MIAVRSMGIRQGGFSLDDVSLTVPDGCYAVLMGKTGSGKTTVVEAICGLRRIAAGTIEVNGQAVHHLDPSRRGIAYVPQDGALFKTMTVRDQILLPMRVRGWQEDVSRKRAEEVASWLGIAHLLSRKPAGLSGGEGQRVALARALGFGPRVICLDEPFSALDEPTREEMYAVIESVRTHAPLTALHVTHNSTESDRLGDIHLRLENGRVITDGGDSGAATPTESLHDASVD